MAIVGGGVAGLASAFYLQEGARRSGAPIDCTLIEADTRVGGKIVTLRERGFVVEAGPDSFLTQKPWAVELCRQLGIADRLMGTNEASRRVYILWRGKLRKLPDGVLLVIPTRFTPFALSTLISPLGKLRMAMDLVIPPRRDPSDESVASFVRRRLGNEALDKIAEPLMGGIHTSDPERQSLLASFPRFAEMERKHGSLVRAMLAGRRAHVGNGKVLPPFVTLRGGLEELVERLASRLDRTRTMLGKAVLHLDRGSAGGYRLRLSDGSQIEADAVVLATPARDSAALVKGIDGKLADRLHSIRYVSTATVSLGYRRDTLSHPLKGFGFVIPSKEGRRITGCTWSSTKFDDRAPEGFALLRCFLGSATNEAPALLPEEEMVRIAREELADIIGIHAEPLFSYVHRWKDSHPQYDVGHLDLLAEIDRLRVSHPGLHLVGSSYRGVGLPDCIRSGQLAAEAILKPGEVAVGR
ncbi:MAG: protoporphyrinogen oxidase [Sphingomonadaceae bacterium]